MYDFENLKKFEPYSEVEHFDLPKSNQMLVVKMDIDKYGVDEAYEIYKGIASQLPSGTLVMGLPKDIDFEIWDVDAIDAAIKELQIAKEKLQ